MKLKHVGMIVVSVLAMSSAAVSAAEGDESVTTTVNGGVIHFKGEVVNAACAIDSESMNQTVELGQVRSSRLAKAGDLSSAVVIAPRTWQWHLKKRLQCFGFVAAVANSRLLIQRPISLP